MVVSFCLGSAYVARFELLAALVFVVGVHLGKVRNRRKAVTSGKGSQAKSKKVPAGRTPLKNGSDVPHFNGRADRVSPSLLRDAEWVIPRVVQLCRNTAQVPQALELYQAAKKVKLDLSEVPEEDFNQLFNALVTASIRALKVEDAQRLLEDIRLSGHCVDADLFASAVKMCTSKQYFAACLAMYDAASADPSFTITDKSVWSCLLFCAMETKAHQRCGVFIENLKGHGALAVQDFGNMLRLAARNCDWKTSLALIQEMRDAKIDIYNVQYNAALATCVEAGKIDEARELLNAVELVEGCADVITYNTVMKGYSKAGRIDEAFELFQRLQARAMTPSQVTYGILLDSCINENQVDRALQVFNDMKKGGCAMNTVLQTMLIKAFIRAGDRDQAMSVYKEMASPDLITFAILIKAYCDNHQLEAALGLLEDMLDKGLRPDEVIFNNLIGGCGRSSNAKLAKQLYDDMIASGIPPSNATFSILIRTYCQCKLPQDAVNLLKTEPAKHKVEPETRLFLQLIQSCVRGRQGKRAIEVYEVLCSRTVPRAATNTNVLSTCMNLNMYDTATEILHVATVCGSHVDARDANAVAEGALKRGKTQLVQSCVHSLHRLGHVIDPKFMLL